MDYDYINKTYLLSFVCGQRVRHQVIKKEGEIIRPNRSALHYVNVRFDGDKHGSLCHPGELEYFPLGIDDGIEVTDEMYAAARATWPETWEEYNLEKALRRAIAAALSARRK